MAIDVSSLSRFVETEIVVRNGRELFGRWKRPDFLKEEFLNEDEVQTFFVDSRFNGRPDRIADEVYGTPFLEWVVVMFNRPKNPLNWPNIGDAIKLPVRSIVIANT